MVLGKGILLRPPRADYGGLEKQKIFIPLKFPEFVRLHEIFANGIVTERISNGMDLSILQKVTELKDQGIGMQEIAHQLEREGISPDIISQAINEVGVTNGQALPHSENPPSVHREKIIQPEPGFDPNAK